MPQLKVLIDKKGNVVGTARTDVSGSGTGSPAQVNLVARADQRIVEVEVEDQVLNVEPSKLHATLRAHYVGGIKASSPRSKSKR